MTNLLLVFLGAAVLKLVLNGSRYYQCQSCLENYQRYLTKKDTSWSWIERNAQVLKLFKDAGIRDVYRPYSEPVGYGQLATGEMSVFLNLHLERGDIVDAVLTMFHQALGAYRSRALETFSPIYWLELVVNLPRRILGFLGLSPESVLARALQLAYWILAALVGFLYTLYKPEADQLVKSWLARLLP